MSNERLFHPLTFLFIWPCFLLFFQLFCVRLPHYFTYIIASATLGQSRIQGTTNKNSVYVTKTEDVKEQRLPVRFSSNMFYGKSGEVTARGCFWVIYGYRHLKHAKLNQEGTQRLQSLIMEGMHIRCHKEYDKWLILFFYPYIRMARKMGITRPHHVTLYINAVAGRGHVLTARD